MGSILASAPASAPAWADAPPAIQPTRDVDVTYKVPVGGKEMALLQRLRFSAAARKQRVDLPTSGNWMVLDFAAHHLSMVRDESHEIVDMPAPATGNANGFARVGPANVAGLPCTEWRTRDTRGVETVACYTNDGVLLQARNEGTVLMQAVTVHYEKQNETIFAVPEGYTHTTP
jgi:hypothetical protein